VAGTSSEGSDSPRSETLRSQQRGQIPFNLPSSHRPKRERRATRHILNFYRYNSVARKAYLDVIEKLSWEEVTRDRGASFPSIRDVFLHVLEAYRYWFECVVKGETVKEYDPECFRGVDDMRRFEQDVDSMVMRLVESLQEDDLTRVYSICCTDSDDEQTSQVSMEAILMHMIEEELQHRGEINCMLRQQDIDPPIAEYHRWSQEDSIKHRLRS
jgi:uncharacterized damage-inducible protein DinB